MRRTRATLSGRWCRAPPPRWAAPQLPQHDAAQRLVKSATKLIVCPVRRDFPASPGQTLLEKMQWSMWRRKAEGGTHRPIGCARCRAGRRRGCQSSWATRHQTWRRCWRQIWASWWAATSCCGASPLRRASGWRRWWQVPLRIRPCSCPPCYRNLMRRQIMQVPCVSHSVRCSCVGYISACVILRGSTHADSTGIAESGRLRRERDVPWRPSQP